MLPSLSSTRSIRLPTLCPAYAQRAESYASQVFHADILNLLSMADMWRNRAPHIPLEFDKIWEGSFPLLRPQLNGLHQNGSAATTNGGARQTIGTGSAEVKVNGTAPVASGSGLKDQRELSLEDNLDLFVSRYVCSAPASVNNLFISALS